MIQNLQGGGVVVTGEGVNLFRLLALKGALKLEIKGMRRSRGPSASAMIKAEFGWKGSKEKLLEKLEAHISEVSGK